MRTVTISRNPSQSSGLVMYDGHSGRNTGHRGPVDESIVDQVLQILGEHLRGDTVETILGIVGAGTGNYRTTPRQEPQCRRDRSPPVRRYARSCLRC